MALLGKAVIFPVGRKVWFADDYGRSYSPREACVDSVERGRIILRTLNGRIVSFSPNSRMLTLTEAECDRICIILNREIVNERKA